MSVRYFQFAFKGAPENALKFICCNKSNELLVFAFDIEVGKLMERLKAS